MSRLPPAPADPANNVVVQASAGTGKTWLLVTRLVRLLLAGAAPESILSITFTRKAAAEMQSRLRERLHVLLVQKGADLDATLHAMGLTPDPASRRRARQCYEELLRGDQAVRVTTFHAFCQDILRRFPFDAGVPPGFELVDSEGLLMDEAWEALLAEATRDPDGRAAAALQVLLDYHGNTDGPRDTLRAFLRQRIDWWAYTQGEADPAAWAGERLRHWLQVAETAPNPAVDFFTKERRAALQEFSELLARHATVTNRKHCDLIHDALAAPPERALETLIPVFFKNDGGPRRRKESATLGRALGEAGLARFLELDRQLGAALATALEQRRRRLTLSLNQAWYRAGQHLLAHYERLKRERRLLDFADLEWHTCRLLQHSTNAHWIQYKLDRRIDHILVDEFQDTNPTQWRLLLPLLEELAAGDPERRRSVFLVGDAKQSIYRFRRADPRLFDTAGRWLAARLAAVTCDLNRSRRSAPAIMDFVNRVFASPPLNADLAPFPRHETHLREQWGRVELLPLVQPRRPAEDTTVSSPGTLRDPLTTPRTPASEDPHYLEGRAIAARIATIVAEGHVLGAGDQARPATYDDFLILARTRNPVHHYERALREAGIPYLGGGKSTLLDCLEIQDLVALLETLVTPYNNLALAAVLRSPLFACSDTDLVHLARLARRDKLTWFDALQRPAAATTGEALARAGRLLGCWHALAGHLPVHDLLDRIYCEGNVLARYRAGFPAHLRSRAQANLVRFIELALAVDSGRYPSLSHFLARLRDLQRSDQEALEEAPVAPRGGGVRLMTIHGAKGLEAPVVILADAARTNQRRRSFPLLLDWPADAPRPVRMLIAGRSAEVDAETRRLLEAAAGEESAEEARLLYVALTRARQWLLISGCSDRRGRWGGWYRTLVQALSDDDEEQERLIVHGKTWETGTPPTSSVSHRASVSQRTAPDPRLCRPLAAPPLESEIAPSATADAVESQGGDRDGRLRGQVIHRLLEQLGRLPQQALDTAATLDKIRTTTGAEYACRIQESPFRDWWQEALAVRRAPHLALLFDPGQYRRAWNEQPLAYRRNGQVINGIIDRLVLREEEIIIVDYKTHAGAREGELASLAEPYRRQMALYREGVQRLWPGLRVRTWLLFTACQEIHEFVD